MKQIIDQQAVLDVLNSLKVIERQGGEDGYALVANSPENRAKLNAVGVTGETIDRYGDEETFCIYALAFNERYADEIKNRMLIKWGPIDDEFRNRVLNGEGTAMDAERLLKLLEPEATNGALVLAKRWLKDIETTGSQASVLATAALAEIAAVENQFPLGTSSYEGMDTGNLIEKLERYENTAYDSRMGVDWLAEIGEGFKLYIKSCLESGQSATLDGFVEWIDKLAVERLGEPNDDKEN